MKQIRNIIFLLIIGLTITYLFGIDKSLLRKDALAIINLIKKSSEPDIYSKEIKAGIRLYSIKLAKYSNKDVVYISKICKTFIDLELSVWDGFIEYYIINNSTKKYSPHNNEKVKAKLEELNSFGIDFPMEQELDKTKEQVDQIRQSMPNSQFREILYTIRRLIWSDYYGTYNAIFN